MANGEWYYARGNQQQGPVALQAIQDMVRSGQLQPTDLVWRQGMPNWLAASQVPELGISQAAAAPAAAPPSASTPRRRVLRRPTRSRAITRSSPTRGSRSRITWCRRSW